MVGSKGVYSISKSIKGMDKSANCLRAESKQASESHSLRDPIEYIELFNVALTERILKLGELI